MVDQNHRFQVSEDFAAARCSKRKKRTIGDLCLMTGSLFFMVCEIIPHITGWGFQPPNKSPENNQTGPLFFPVAQVSVQSGHVGMGVSPTSSGLFSWW